MKKLIFWPPCHVFTGSSACVISQTGEGGEGDCLQGIVAKCTVTISFGVVNYTVHNLYNSIHYMSVVHMSSRHSTVLKQHIH